MIRNILIATNLYTISNLTIQEVLGLSSSLAEDESRSRVYIYRELAILTLQNKHIIKVTHLHAYLRMNP